MKRILSLMMAIALCVLLIPSKSAMAGTQYIIKRGEVQITVPKTQQVLIYENKAYIRTSGDFYTLRSDGDFIVYGGVTSIVNMLTGAEETVPDGGTVNFPVSSDWASVSNNMYYSAGTTIPSGGGTAASTTCSPLSALTSPWVISESEDEASSSVEIETAASVVNITLPLNVAITVDPNADVLITAGDFEIVNNTMAPVKITLQSFTQKSGFANVIKPDELPATLNWNSLSKENTAKYFSIGVKPIDVETKVWKSKAASEYVYSCSSFAPTLLGVVNGNETVYLGFDIHCGKAVAENKKAQFGVVILAEIE